MTTVLSQGTVLSIGDGASPEVFNAIGEIRTIGGPDGEAPTIIVSNLSSTAVQKRLGLKDEGQVALGMAYDPDDTYQASLKTHRDNKTSANFKITGSGSPAKVTTFAAFVKTYAFNYSVDEVVLLESLLDISGDVTIT